MSTQTAQLMIISHGLGRMAKFLSALDLWFRRAHERRELARLSERELNDIGVSWATAVNEIEKPFWRS